MKTICEPEAMTANEARQTIVVQQAPRRLNLLLVAFVLLCAGVVAVDRYLTTDSCRLAMEANDYNVRETLRIIEVGKAQGRVEEALLIIRDLQVGLKRSNESAAVLLQHNMQMFKLLQDKGITVPVPPAQRTFDKDKDA